MAKRNANENCLASMTKSPGINDDLVMISALQHFLFCKRQCALIHLEGAWEENSLTASGRVLHEHVDKPQSETRRTIRQATALRLVSQRLGIFGVADMVEFHASERECDDAGIRIAVPLPRSSGFWRPFPIEYKRGRPKSHRADEVQLCAQAICLEEMLGVAIPSGALFYGEPRKRTDVEFDPPLRLMTEETARGVHALFDSGITPEPSLGKWCSSCSLLEACRPQMISSNQSARQWFNHELETVLREDLL